MSETQIISCFSFLSKKQTNKLLPKAPAKIFALICKFLKLFSNLFLGSMTFKTATTWPCFYFIHQFGGQLVGWRC